LRVVFERLADGKIRATTRTWDDPKVISPNQVLEVAVIGKQAGLDPNPGAGKFARSQYAYSSAKSVEESPFPGFKYCGKGTLITGRLTLMERLTG
jgi:hypothetical protein